MLTTLFKGFMYAIREKYGAAATLEIYERVNKIDDRVKKMVHTLKDVFKIEGNDIEAITKWFKLWFELTGFEVTWFEQSKTISEFKSLGCSWITKPEDFSEWFLIISNIVAKTINPKATIERPIGMCAGDSSCEYIIKLEE